MHIVMCRLIGKNSNFSRFFYLTKIYCLNGYKLQLKVEREIQYLLYPVLLVMSTLHIVASYASDGKEAHVFNLKKRNSIFRSAISYFLYLRRKFRFMLM